MDEGLPRRVICPGCLADLRHYRWRTEVKKFNYPQCSKVTDLGHDKAALEKFLDDESNFPDMMY